jgi:hypothetical protein
MMPMWSMMIFSSGCLAAIWPSSRFQIGAWTIVGMPQLLGDRPVPVVGAVDHPVAVLRPVEGEPRALDVRVLGEVLQHRGALFGLVLRDAGHDAEAVRVRLAGLQGVVDAVALPGRRQDQRPVDAGLVHQLQGLLVREGVLAVAVEADALPRARDPGAVRGLFLPDVDLRVDDEHVFNSSLGPLAWRGWCGGVVRKER